jgi:hypothetical protein
MTNDSYVQTLEQWRAKKEQELRAEEGWLALVGLFTLHEGHNAAGSDPSNEILLPEGTAPAFAGDFVFDGTQTTLHVMPGAPVTVDGAPAVTQVMKPDVDGPPTRAVLGSLVMQVIRRGKRYLVRIHDRNHPARQSFTGRRWYPIDPAWRISARFVAYDPPRNMDISNVLGDTDPTPNPGYALFSLQGQEARLDALAYGRALRFIIGDATSGHGTYPAGRYLDSEPPQDGQLVLDFNRAYSPPCAFTDYATCPLPPPQNHLKAAVEAGERYEGHA